MNSSPVNIFYYQHYADANFVVLRSRNDVDILLKWLNDLHHNIIFTCEIEKKKKLNFLDVSVVKETGR